MSMKTILVPTESHDAMQSALETALLLARRCDSYIEGFALRLAITEFIGADMAGGIPLETFKHDSVEETKLARQVFEGFMQKHNVPRSTGKAGPLSFGWLDEAPEGESFVGSYGRVFDVIVMNRPKFKFDRTLLPGDRNPACSRAAARSFCRRRRRRGRSAPMC